MSVSPNEHDELLPRDNPVFYAIFWLASIVLITCGLFACGHDDAVSGVAQMLLGIVIGVAGMTLVAIGTPRD